MVLVPNLIRGKESKLCYAVPSQAAPILFRCPQHYVCHVFFTWLLPSSNFAPCRSHSPLASWFPFLLPVPVFRLFCPVLESTGFFCFRMLPGYLQGGRWDWQSKEGQFVYIRFLPDATKAPGTQEKQSRVLLSASTIEMESIQCRQGLQKFRSQTTTGVH